MVLAYLYAEPVEAGGTATIAYAYYNIKWMVLGYFLPLRSLIEYEILGALKSFLAVCSLQFLNKPHNINL